MNKPKISQKLDQNFSLSPQQLIRVNILQLNSMMLETRLYQELESNPALEIVELDSNVESENEDKLDERDDTNLEDEENEHWEAKSSYYDNETDITSNLKSPTTITDQVISALRDDNLSDQEIKIAEQVTGNLDDQGYLKIDPELIADKLKISQDSIMEVVEKIKHSQFPGLASSNIQDCLVAQLEVYQISSLSSIIINDYFDDFMNRRYDKIIEKLKCSQDDLQEALTIISQLNPNPRSMIDETDYKKQTIIPDVVIEQMNDKWNIIVNDSNCPDLTISENYTNMLKDKKQDRDVKIFLKSKIESAKWFIEAIESRNKTIQDIMASIIMIQDNYFNSDNKELKPMILKDIADILNIDISTVSRATKEKYVQMPWGIRELKSFFSQGFSSAKGIISPKVIKERIKNIIDSENKTKPFRDNELAEILASEGIARRTIAKYREELNFPIARLRKELK